MVWADRKDNHDKEKVKCLMNFAESRIQVSNAPSVAEGLLSSVQVQVVKKCIVVLTRDGLLLLALCTGCNYDNQTNQTTFRKTA